ncbi:MAG: hypothetical protein AAFO73_07500 [Pseudomonadota bacterium]
MRYALTAAALALAVLGSSVTVDQASAKALSSQDIKRAIAGKKVLLQTRWGSFPLRYNRNARVTGDGRALGLARYFSPKETGRWWVANNRLCQRFPTWYKGQTSCFRLRKTGPNTLSWVRQDGFRGTALISR